MIKTPVRYDGNVDTLIRDAEGQALVSVCDWRYNWRNQSPESGLMPEDGHKLAEYIAACINDHAALTVRLKEAEVVIEHYGDSKAWAQRDAWAGDNYYVGENDNGYDKAREYLSKYGGNPTDAAPKTETS